MGQRILNIGGIEIGEGKRPLVIPEIGINHGGSLDIAKQMVKAAYLAGARLIKHQTHIVEDEMAPAAKAVVPGNADVSIYDIMAECALTEEEEQEMKRYTESFGMVFISTPFSRAAAERLERLGVSAYKIGSGEMNHYPLIDYVASFGKPMIVSTGMNDIRAVHKTVDIMERRGVPYALMHTTNLYPTKPEQVRLGAMAEMMREFPGVPVGLSDHTLNNNACKAALALGANLVERHFTDTMQRTGPDVPCSMDKEALEDLLAAAKEIPKMLGGEKKPLAEEQVTIDFAFATAVTIAPVKKGDVFTKENLWVKRPGTGEIFAEDYGKILGRRAVREIAKDVQLTWDMVE